VFNASAQQNLTLIQACCNRLTGTIPAEIFLLPQLETLVLDSNCFHGALPLGICNSSNLKTLCMDGLQSADTCQDKIFPGSSSAYQLRSQIRDGIPQCMFNMDSLTTLHLSGNGLTGSLPESAEISPYLVDISLSHNKLIGSIPRNFQRKLWYNLDLSYNKLGGVLFEDFASQEPDVSVLDALGIDVNNVSNVFSIPSAAVTLRNNRLSDTVPPVLFERINISILQGNLFGCDLQASDLPRSDQGYATYQCGSNYFNISFYAFLSTSGFVLAVGLALYYWRKRIVDYFNVEEAMGTVRVWLHAADWQDLDNSTRGRSRLHRYKYVVMVCALLFKVGYYSMFYILFVLMPIYAAVSSYYGTHYHEYAWGVSVSFLSGIVPFSLIFVAFMILLGIVLTVFRMGFQELRRYLHGLPPNFHFSIADKFEDEDREELQMTENRYSSLTEKVVVYAAFFVINVFFVASVNSGYVYVAIYGSNNYVTVAQISLSFFKLIWNNIVSLYLIRATHHYLAQSAAEDWKSKATGFFAVQLFVALFNYLVIPCVVVMLISPDCFNNVVVDPPEVTATYYFRECVEYSAIYGCITYSPQSATTSYAPPFIYNYQCSSALITYYAPTFVYLGFIVMFVTPLMEVLGQYLHEHCDPSAWYYGQVHYWVPPILHNLDETLGTKEVPYDIFNPYLDANNLLVSISTYLGMLLTFGLVFPPLAVVMLFTIASVIYLSRVEVGRFLTSAINKQLYKYIDIIEAECQGVGSIPKLRQCVRTIFAFVCFFYAPFLFDILGDAVGLDRALWVLLFVPLLPVVVLFFHEGRKRYYRYVYSRYRQEPSVDRQRSSEFRGLSFQAKEDFVKSLQAENELLAAAAAVAAATATSNWAPGERKSALIERASFGVGAGTGAGAGAGAGGEGSAPAFSRSSTGGITSLLFGSKAAGSSAGGGAVPGLPKKNRSANNLEETVNALYTREL
jgi:hypothetical protein